MGLKLYICAEEGGTPLELGGWPPPGIGARVLVLGGAGAGAPLVCGGKEEPGGGCIGIIGAFA